jgi:capsular exopolysaccharide synthesis family protein
MSNTLNNNETIDFGAMLRNAIKHWYIFAISIVMCLALALVYTRIHTPSYLVKANLIITSEDSDATTSLAGLSSLFGSNTNVDDEVFAVSSHTVLRNVVDQLGINQRHSTKEGFLKWEFNYRDYPVTLKYDSAIADTLRTALNFKITANKAGEVDVKVKAKRSTVAKVTKAKFPVKVKTPYGVFVVEKTKAYPEGEGVTSRISLMGLDAATERIAEKVDIDIASRKSNVITLELESTDIDYAKDVLNEIMVQYNKRGLAETAVRNTKTLNFLDSRLALLSDDLVESEANIETFKKNHDIVDITTEATYQITKKGKFEEELVAAETELEIVKMIKEFLANPENKYELVPALISGDQTNSAINGYNDLIMKRITLLQDAHGNNATLKALNSQINAFRENILQTIDRSIESARIKVHDLLSGMTSTESRLGDIPAQERQYRTIVRQQKIKEQIYIFLLQEREQASMRLANATEKGQVIDEAYAENEPLGIGNAMVLAIALIIGFILGAIILYLRKLLRNKFESREELEQYTQVPILGEMCTNHSGEALVVRNGGSNSAAELFRLMRSNLQFILNGENDKVILLTSTISGEGKSFISINLSSSLALLHKRVLLVGMDIRSPKLAEYLNLPHAPGITEYLAGDRYTLNDIIRKDPLGAGMDIITAGPVPPNPSELLNSEKVDRTFEELRQLYDYIIIDSAPVGMVSDTFSLRRISDATVYVTRANYSTTKEIKFFNAVYRDKRLKKMSIVVNGTHTKKGYGYGYGTKVEK